MIQLGTSLKGRLIGRRITFDQRAELALVPGAPAVAPGIVATSSSLEGVVRQKLSGKLGDDPGIRFGDGSFYLPTVKEVQHILKSSQLDRRQWMEERFDCDDFAYVLKGEMSVHAYESNDLRFALCVGMVWGDFDWVQGYHAVNWFIASDREIRFIEPQSDEIYDLTHCQGKISLLLV